MMTLRLLVTLLAAILFVNGNAQDWNGEARAFLAERAIDEADVPAPPGTNEELHLMGRLSKFLSDSSYSLRGRAIQMIYNVGIHSIDTAARQTGVRLILEPLVRQDHEVAGTSLALLRTFQRHDYDREARMVLRKLISAPSTHTRELIKIAGFLRLNDLSGKLRQLALPGNPHTTRWAAILTLARMGDEAALDEMMLRVMKLPVNDEVVYQVFPDLVFTRQQRAIGYLTQLISSNDAGCRSSDAERDTPIPCAYRILEQLIPVIENFPLSVDQTGDINTNDYPAALETARTWFKQNGTYHIIDDKY